MQASNTFGYFYESLCQISALRVFPVAQNKGHLLDSLQVASESLKAKEKR
jgi:hypothetical protein